MVPGISLCAAVLVAGCGGKPSEAPGPVPLPSIEPTTSAPPSSAPLEIPSTETTLPPTTAPGPAPGPGPAPKPSLPGAGTADVSLSRSGVGHLTAVRLGNQGSYDRLVLEFKDQVPGYTVGYRPLPAKADGSGNPIALPGAKALVMVTMRSATGYDAEKSSPTYTGPNEVTAKSVQVTQAKAAGDFESVLSWAVGLKSKVPFKVSIMNAPPRLVIDFQH
jgi:hypothetical protein